MKYIILIFLLFFVFISINCDKTLVSPVIKQSFWSTSTPEEQHMDSEILDSAFATAEDLGFVDALLIIRNGSIVGEMYYNGYNQLHPHNVQSVSKSFLSAIVGLAIDKGFLDNLDEKVMDYFPEYDYSTIDRRKYNITLEHLLTMRMGIRNEADEDYGVFWGLFNSENWIRSTIEYPLVDNPGEKMHYNTFQTHLLSGIITKSTFQSTMGFANEYLFGPMDIDCDAWLQDPQGIYFGGSEMYFTPREMAKLGYLYLNNGVLDGKQIIPESWVVFTLTSSTNLTHPNEWGAMKNYNYAYLWWLGQFNEYDMFMAYGYGGQFVVVFPSLDMIVVSTAPYQVYSNQSTIQEFAIFDLISDYILPSVID